MDIQIDIRNGDSKMIAGMAGHRFVVGTKQLRKSLESGKAVHVYLAENADPALTEPIEALCHQYHVAYTWVPSKAELGQACGIEVGAAAAAAVD